MSRPPSETAQDRTHTKDTDKGKQNYKLLSKKKLKVFEKKGFLYNGYPAITLSFALPLWLTFIIFGELIILNIYLLRHTPNPRIGIKIPDPAGNRTRAAGLEGRDSTDHATATDILMSISFIFYIWDFHSWSTAIYFRYILYRYFKIKFLRRTTVICKENFSMYFPPCWWSKFFVKGPFI